MTRPARIHRILNPVQVFPWRESGALQNLVQGELLRPDWVAVVPAHLDRPKWIPRGAELHPMTDRETVAFTWSDA